MNDRPTDPLSLTPEQLEGRRQIARRERAFGSIESAHAAPTNRAPAPVSRSEPEPAPEIPPPDQDHKVIQLAERAPEVLHITELEPANGAFIGKPINADGTVTKYPETILWWKPTIVAIPATSHHLSLYYRTRKLRNVCNIRGVPADPQQIKTLRRNKFFVDEPTRLLPLDFDKVKIKWRDDPERAVQNLVAQLGEPWASTSFVWFFSASHGLERDEHDRWTGRISDGTMSVRVVFLTDRALNVDEATALTRIAKARNPQIDRAFSRLVQINYIRRPLWAEHPDRDALGDIPTIGWVKGPYEYLAVPANLEYKARRAKAEGIFADIAVHPDAETAVRSIGRDGHLYEHMMSAVVHLLDASPPPDVISFADHARSIALKLQAMVEQHRDEISNNLAQYNRSWAEIAKYAADIERFAQWRLDNPGSYRPKTIKFVKETWTEATDGAMTREEILAWVERVIESARDEVLASIPLTPPLLERELKTAGSEYRWWFNVLRRGSLPFDEWGHWVSGADLFHDYTAHVKKHSVPRLDGWRSRPG